MLAKLEVKIKQFFSLSRLLELAFVIGIIALTLIQTREYFAQYLASDLVGGWEGDGHFTASLQYSQEIFPSLFGRLDNWNLGTTWPLGYSPMISYMFSLLYRLFPQLEPVFIFKFFFVLLSFAIPLIVYRLGLKIYRQKAAGFLLAIAYLLLLGRANSLDVADLTYAGAFEIGSYSFYLATSILLLLIYTAISAKRTRGYMSTGLLLGALILTNIHVAEIGILFILLYLILQSKFWNKFLIIAITSLGLTAFWLIPLLQNNSYFLAKTLPAVPLTTLLSALPVWMWGAGLLGLTALIFSKVAKPLKLSIGLSFVVAILIAILPMGEIFPWVPIQPNRFLNLAFLFLILTVPAAISTLPKRIKQLIVSIVVVFTFLSSPVTAVNNGIWELEYADVQLINQLSKLSDGKSLIEYWYEGSGNDTTWGRGNPVSNKITSYVTKNTHSTLWGIFRESSIGSPFVQPIRNFFNTEKESYGVTCFLCYEDTKYPSLATQFYEQDLLKQLFKTRYLGVKYFVVASKESKQKLQSAKQYGVEKLFETGDWMVFEDTSAPSATNLVNSTPILTFTHLNSRNRDVSEYDWLRLNEEWLFQDMYRLPLALANDKSLDISDDLDRFENILLIDYKFNDLEQAYQRLTKYAESKGIFLLEDNNALYQKLAAAAGENPQLKIYLISRTGGVRDDMKRTFDYMLSIINPEPFSSTSLAVEGSQEYTYGFKLSQKDGWEKILISQNYFPWWKPQSADTHVYMSSPSLMMILTKSEQPIIVFVPQLDVVKVFYILFFGILIGVISYRYRRVFWRLKHKLARAMNSHRP